MATYDLTSAIPSNIATGDILNCPYSGTYKTITLPKGIYQFECWGAQGGTSFPSRSIPGKGGYSKGVLTLTTDTTVYIYVGGAGTSTTGGTSATGGFNGGGTAIGSYSSSSYGNGSGGGASDIRIDTNSLYARVIVAGGGGGCGNGGTSTIYGGSGGGTNGITASGGSPGVNAGGGSQTAGGVGGYWSGNSKYQQDGSFGQGGSFSGTYSCSAGGGGGGWYGGGSATWQCGGGGSGYVYTSSTASNYPSGCLLDSSMYLTDAQTIAGNTSMPSTSGSTETGHSGNGYVRITVISVDAGLPFKMKQNGEWKEASGGYVKVSGEWKEISKVFHKSNGEWIED